MLLLVGVCWVVVHENCHFYLYKLSLVDTLLFGHFTYHTITFKLKPDQIVETYPDHIVLKKRPKDVLGY